MHRRLMLAMIAAVCLASCAEERHVVRDNSAETQFANIFANDGRWQMDRKDVPQPKTPPKPEFKPVEGATVTGPVNNSGFKNVKFITSFQTDEDAQQPKDGQDPWLTKPPSAPGAAPAPASPATPGSPAAPSGQ